MRIQHLIRGMTMLVILLASVVSFSHPAAASLPPDSQSVYPQAGPPGSMFFFSASSFRSERVGYWFNAPNGKIYANRYRYAVYAYEGRVNWRWQVPYDAQPGWWTAVVQGEESGRQQVIPFEVTVPINGTSAIPSEGTPANTPEVAVQPAIGTPGTNIIFSAAGLDGERAGYWFTDPTGHVLGDDERFWFKTDVNPAVWSWKAPNNAQPGIWRVTVRGEESGIEYTIFFEIQRPPETPLPQTMPVNAPCLGAVEPAVGEPNTEFKFFATGFPPRTQVQYWAEDPNGRKYGYDEGKAIGSNPDGRVDIAWNAPDNAMYGYWTMYFLSYETGKNPSRIERVIYFEIRRPGEPIPPQEQFVPPPPCIQNP